MKKAQLIEVIKGLTDEQKEQLKHAGYYKIWGGHYWVRASCCLAISGARGGVYVGKSWVQKQKRFKLKEWAQRIYIVYPNIVDVWDWDTEFRGHWGGCVYNVFDLLDTKTWNECEIEDIRKDYEETKTTYKVKQAVA